MASLDFDVQADIVEARRALGRLGGRIVPRAASRSLNRVASSVRTQARRDTAKAMGIKQKHIKDAFVVNKAKRRRLHASVEGSGHRLPLILFKSTRQTKQGVVSAAWGQRKLYKHAFIATMPSPGQGAQHRGVFVRQSAKRLPIKELFGPGVPKTMLSRQVEAAMEDRARERWQTEFPRNVQHEINRFWERG